MDNNSFRKNFSSWDKIGKDEKLTLIREKFRFQIAIRKIIFGDYLWEVIGTSSLWLSLDFVSSVGIIAAGKINPCYIISDSISNKSIRQAIDMNCQVIPRPRGLFSKATKIHHTENYYFYVM